jgi:16S rRNA (uracil1498-N3)-methyltransferase
VLRLGPGAGVAVFDGRGREFAGRVSAAGPSGVTIEVLEPRAAAPEPAVRITLAQVVLKGDKMDEVVRDAVMVGAAGIQPVVSARAETTLATLRRAGRVERWRRIAVASAKQCGRAVVPQVHEASALDACASGADVAACRLVLVEPSHARAAGLDALASGARPAAAVVLVGPEGGWTSDETALLETRGFRAISLGPRTLRADAVPIVALSLLQFVWRDL